MTKTGRLSVLDFVLLQNVLLQGLDSSKQMGDLVNILPMTQSGYGIKRKSVDRLAMDLGGNVAEFAVIVERKKLVAYLVFYVD